MRVVVDTNVLISALLWGGTPHQILILAEARRITLCASPAMITELAGVLGRRKFQRALKKRETTVHQTLELILPLLEVGTPASISKTSLNDPDDEIFLACAAGANAEIVISGDDHLLRLKQFAGIKIVKVNEFLRLFSETPDRNAK